MGEEKEARGGVRRRGEATYCRARGHVCERAGASGCGDHELSKTLASSP